MKASGAAPAMAILSFGALLINTIPAWIAELAEARAVSEATAGALASLVLLSAAAACALSSRARATVLVWGALAALPLSLGALAFSAYGSAAGAAVICVALGAALGVLSAIALAAASRLGALQQIIGRSLGVGLIAALFVFLANFQFGMRVLWMLLVIAVVLLPIAARLGQRPALAPQSRATSGTSFPAWQLPFFVMMGAYWAFLEVYARALGGGLDGALSIWLSGSLLSGALGSLVASFTGNRATAQAALLCAALTGAVSYIAPSIGLLGLSIVANGFFLFLYFPLYLAGPGVDGAGENAVQRMAVYLLGFAAGGLIGAMVLKVAGFAGLATAIALSGIIGLRRPRTQAP